MFLEKVKIIHKHMVDNTIYIYNEISLLPTLAPVLLA